jgi:GNAT superfamily N-acetyltransferase
MQLERRASAGDVIVRPLLEQDLDAADRIMRLAFGTFLGMPDPLNFMGDADYVRSRWKTDPSAAFAAEVNGELTGSNFALRWGSVGFFGPLTVRPDLWDRGIGKRLMEPVLDRFASWNVKHAGFYTFADSQKHIAFYQRFDFWPRFLTAIMGKPAEPKYQNGATISLFSQLPEAQRESTLDACREVTEVIFEGLDLQSEIRAVAEHKYGDTVLLWNDSKLEGFAVCHTGAGTEAGSGSCYVKFAAVRPGAGADAAFERLLDACEQYASSAGAAMVVAGVNMSRHEAYRAMLARGFRTLMHGVIMQRGNEAGYNVPGIYLIDDWR